MGVNIYSCNICSEALWEDQVEWCHECEERVCDDCSGDGEDENGEEVTVCESCSGDIVTDSDLLAFIMREMELDLQEWRIKYFENFKKN